MKKKIIHLLALALTPLAVWSQAPVGPTMETNLSRIDSLTRILYMEIPSHTAAVDSFSDARLNKTTFESQMNMLGSSIPFDFHASVQAQISYLMRQSDNFFEELHKRMQLYFPIYEQVLDKYNLPQELKYVSIIESNLNPNAQSWCGAMGLWQFMPYTGRSMGMRIDYSIDERKSIMASTEKACEFFTNSMTLLNDWLLAISSYNCGAGNVQRAIARAGTREYWKVRYFLPKETQGYVPRFIATAYVLNFTKFSRYNYNGTSSVLVETPVDSSISIGHLASYLGVDESEIFTYNRELLKKTTVEKHTQTIMLPYSLSMQFLENKDSAYAFARKQAAIEDANKPVYVKKWVPHYHYVRKGQTLYSIAKSHHVTVAQLKAWNNLKKNVAPAGRNLIYYRLEWVSNKNS
ncbi:MAG: transglycosylase SLT domain-containing protein [Bacteroidetes bacterium]|nr:transglycosylase SLT domain-containing protein [Bacteroidota bacterium]